MRYINEGNKGCLMTIFKPTLESDWSRDKTKNFKNLEKYLYSLAEKKMGFPTSLLASNPTFIDNQVLGIRRNSLANILINDVGDPFKKSETWRIEVKDYEMKLIQTLSAFYGIPKGQGRGYITTGGTEGNEACLRWSKQFLGHKLRKKMHTTQKQKELALQNRSYIEKELNLLQKKLGKKIKPEANIQKITSDIKTGSHKSKTYLTKIISLTLKEIKLRKHIDKLNTIIFEITHPTLFCTDHYTHYSILKICKNLNFQVILIKAQAEGTMDLQAFEKKIFEHLKKHPDNPIIINVNIGATLTGAIDNTPQIKKILDRCKLKPSYTIHMDGANLGFVLPILKPYGSIKNYFEYADTLSISFHKYLGLPQPCGLALTTKIFLNKAYRNHQNRIEYAGNISDITVSGSRSGFNVLLVYNAIINALSLHTTDQKIKELVASDLKMATYLYQQLNKVFANKKIFYIPNQFTILIPKPTRDIIQKYQLMISGDKAIIYVGNSVTTELVNEFILDIKNAKFQYKRSKPNVRNKTRA